MTIFRWIAARKAEHSVQAMCRVLGVSRTGFHAWERRAPCDRALADAFISERVKQIHGRSRGTYGARRVHAELRHQVVLHSLRQSRRDSTSRDVLLSHLRFVTHRVGIDGNRP